MPAHQPDAFREESRARARQAHRRERTEDRLREARDPRIVTEDCDRARRADTDRAASDRRPASPSSRRRRSTVPSDRTRLRRRAAPRRATSRASRRSAARAPAMRARTRRRPGGRRSCASTPCLRSEATPSLRGMLPRRAPAARRSRAQSRRGGRCCWVSEPTRQRAREQQRYAPPRNRAARAASASSAT